MKGNLLFDLRFLTLFGAVILRWGDAESASHNLSAALKEFAVPPIAQAAQPRAK